MNTGQPRKEALESMVIAMLDKNYEAFSAFNNLEEFIDIIVQTTEEWCLKSYLDNEDC